VCSLSADPTSWIYSKGNPLKFWPGVGYGKKWLRRTKVLIISLKRGKIGPRLLLTTNRKAPTRFRLVPKSTTLDDLEGLLFYHRCEHRSLFRLTSIRCDVMCENY